MLSNVTWSEYLAVVVTLLLFYYLFVAIRYYREDIKSLLSGKLQKKPNIGSPDKSTTEKKSSDPALEELEVIVNDLRYAVLEKAGRSIGKQELLSQLKERLANYAGLQKSAFRVAINNYIITNAKEICGIQFNEHELNSAWDRLSH